MRCILTTLHLRSRELLLWRLGAGRGIWVTENLVWMVWCRGLTLERWRQECLLVEERFSLFRSFAEAPFFGFRGVVARAGCEYRVTVAAEMDFYPQYLPWVFVEPHLAGAREDGKLCLDLAWRPDSS